MISPGWVNIGGRDAENYSKMVPWKSDEMKTRRYAAWAFLLAAVLFMACSPPYTRRGVITLDERERRGVVETALGLIGVQYQNGGEGPGGFDCSGYVMYVYGRHGLKLPRSAQDQYGLGRRISLRYARQGDLVFFHTSPEKRITHVGVYLGNGRFVHAPSSGKSVSIASLRNGYWKRRYMGAVTYFSTGFQAREHGYGARRSGGRSRL